MKKIRKKEGVTDPNFKNIASKQMPTPPPPPNRRYLRLSRPLAWSKQRCLDSAVAAACSTAAASLPPSKPFIAETRPWLELVRDKGVGGKVPAPPVPPPDTPPLCPPEDLVTSRVSC